MVSGAALSVLSVEVRPMANETAFPLAWPLGWTRCTNRRTAKFRTRDQRSLSVEDAIWRLDLQLGRLVGRQETEHSVVSTNLKVTLRGGLTGSREINDPGAAVYFTLAGRRTVLACDKWNRVADNIAAIAAHIDCLRGIDRYGVGTIEQAFFGYQQLAAPNTEKPWRQIITGCNTLEEAETKYYARIKQIHPDVPGGNAIQAAEWTRAIREARAEFGRNGA